MLDTPPGGLSTMVLPSWDPSQAVSAAGLCLVHPWGPGTALPVKSLLREGARKATHRPRGADTADSWGTTNKQTEIHVKGTHGLCPLQSDSRGELQLLVVVIMRHVSAISCPVLCVPRGLFPFLVTQGAAPLPSGCRRQAPSPRKPQALWVSPPLR